MDLIQIYLQLRPIFFNFFSFFLKIFAPGSGSRKENKCGSGSTALSDCFVFSILQHWSANHEETLCGEEEGGGGGACGEHPGQVAPPYKAPPPGNDTPGSNPRPLILRTLKGRQRSPCYCIKREFERGNYTYELRGRYKVPVMVVIFI